MRRIWLLLPGLLIICNSFSQSYVDSSDKSLPDTTINFTASEAADYIFKLVNDKDTWKSAEDTFRLSLSRLIEHFGEPIDSVEKRLNTFNYNAVEIRDSFITISDTIPLRWLNDTTVIIDTTDLDKEPVIYRETIIKTMVDTSRHSDTIVSEKNTDLVDADTIVTDSVRKDEPVKLLITSQDTISEEIIDTAYLYRNNIRIHQFENGRFIPPLISSGNGLSARLHPDSGSMIISQQKNVLQANQESPFYIVKGYNMPDSLRAAVSAIVTHTYVRDSFLVYLNDIKGRKIPFWLTEQEDEPLRYWVSNDNNDSITVWMGNPSKKEISLILERDVNFTRLKKVQVEDYPIIDKEPEITLAKAKPLEEIPVYWNYGFSTSFSLNQTYLSNWSKGGENSFSSLLDIQGSATYTHKQNKTTWTNSGRLKFGNMITEEYGLRTNTDQLEFNSQYNKEIIKKMDFSSVFYLKNQIAKGYNFPNDSVVVSKFLNPGTFTIGVGVEYKPFKKTTLNFSLLSYKNTFVMDTANIDQTLHGIDSDMRANQEMGGQLVLTNSATLLDGLTINNKIRLFTNYLSEPENVDVDWEIDIEKKFSWYFTILMNFHMIYDDDIRFPVLDDNNQPVILPDGSEKKVPKLQFKQFLGLTFLFKF